ncbi:hypothetical protein V7S43_007257 [Phytophthora oleae]|uniref:Uncharacterized protein n=1 Tax=Phytophthora oleae TaxID=2107226 RepID=A0ABD3FQ13_9STRA
MRKASATSATPTHPRVIHKFAQERWRQVQASKRNGIQKALLADQQPEKKDRMRHIPIQHISSTSSTRRAMSSWEEQVARLVWQRPQNGPESTDDQGTTEASAEAIRDYQDGVPDFFPESNPRDWFFLKSLPGGEAQPAHRNFSSIPPDQDLYDYTRLQVSVIVAIDEGSYIYGYGWNRIPADEQER